MAFKTPAQPVSCSPQDAFAHLGRRDAKPRWHTGEAVLLGNRVEGGLMVEVLAGHS